MFLSDGDADMIVGYTAGAFDLFHIGHLNILRNARSMCDRLVVGVSTDELIVACKGRRPVVPFEERMASWRASGTWTPWWPRKT